MDQLINFSNFGIFKLIQGLVWFGGFYGISTFLGYLTPNPFYVTNQFYFKQVSLPWVHSLSKTFLFQTIQFSQAVI